MAETSLSVVVAAWPDGRGLEACLAALEAQRHGRTELVVVSPSPPEPDRHRLDWVAAPADRLIPHLWGLGLERATGEIVALTTAHFVPADDWLAAIRRAHARFASAAIGGAIEPPDGGGSVDWATYFIRYSAYLGLAREQEVADVAGDNASYKRAALLSRPGWARRGFWEREFHARLRADGETVTFVPEIRVRLQSSFGFGGFLRQRFRHGRQFGGQRARGRSPALRALAVAASPLVPLVLLGRITVRVARSGRDLGRFALALPALGCFTLAWAAGEASGYLLGEAPTPEDRG